MTEGTEHVSLEARIASMPDRFLGCRDYASHGWNWPATLTLNEDETLTRVLVCVRCPVSRTELLDRRTGDRIKKPVYTTKDAAYYLKGYGRVPSATFRQAVVQRAVERIERRRTA